MKWNGVLEGESGTKRKENINSKGRKAGRYMSRKSGKKTGAMEQKRMDISRKTRAFPWEPLVWKSLRLPFYCSSMTFLLIPISHRHGSIMALRRPEMDTYSGQTQGATWTRQEYHPGQESIISVKLAPSHCSYIIKTKLWPVQIITNRKKSNCLFCVSCTTGRRLICVWWVRTGVQQRRACRDVDFLQKLQCFSMKEANGGTLGERHPHPSAGTRHVCDADHGVRMDFKFLRWKQQRYYKSRQHGRKNAIIHIINKSHFYGWKMKLKRSALPGILFWSFKQNRHFLGGIFLRIICGSIQLQLLFKPTVL